MKIKWAVLLTVLSALAGILEGRKGFGRGEQDFGYIDVRPGAHMFYWLYYTTAPQGTYTDRPLVLWLQGGPGASSSGFGNFEEIGPLTVDLKARNSTWVKHVNLLFVDNPVGSGFSYVDKKTSLATTNQQIGKDLVELMRGFLNIHPSFQKVPFYIFCESYGGKMAVEFALQLEKERVANKIKVNIKGIGLGDAWISPVDSVLTWAPYLYHTGLLDQKGFDEVDKYAQRTANAIKMGNYFQATALWSRTEQVIFQLAGGVDFYNILTPIRQEQNRYGRSGTMLDEPRSIDDAELQKLMNGPVRLALDDVIPEKVFHGSQGSSVFNYLYQDFMRPATDVVEELLNTTSLEIVVYTGQLDLIVGTPGTVQWVDRLKWSQAESWISTPRRTFEVNGIVEGFVKRAKKLALYWINRAGHMVPVDNPNATIELLRRVTKFDIE